MSERQDDEIVFSALDPIRGKGRELARVPAYGKAWYWWDLSSDGSRIALVELHDNLIRLIDLGGRIRELRVSAWYQFQNVTWTARNDGLFVTSWSSQGIALLHMDLGGHVHVLRRSHSGIGRVVSSPDGRYLAFNSWTLGGNVWLVEGI